MMEKIDYSKFVTKVLRDKPDERDFIYAPRHARAFYPSKYLNENIREIENQYSLGSCVANAAVSSIEMMAKDNTNLSRLFLYYNLRKDYANFAGQDNGSYTRDAYRYANKYGICEESEWPYIISTVHDEPSKSAYNSALNNRVLKYERISKVIDDVKSAIYDNQGVIFSMKIGRDFYKISGDLSTHNYKIVSATNSSVGNHAMALVGWDDELDGFIVENSWGSSWGDGGLFLLKYDVFLSDVMDIWTCSEVTFIGKELTFFEKVYHHIYDTVIWLINLPIRAFNYIKGLF